MTIKPYITMDYDLLRADGFFNKSVDSKILEEYTNIPTLTPNDKIVYSYVRARLKYFVEDSKGEYYDTQEAIAKALAMNISSSRKSLNKFIACGILVAKREKFRNYFNYRYKSLGELDLWAYDDSKVVTPIIPVYYEKKSEAVAVGKPNVQQPQQNYQPDPISWFYDEQEPF